MEEQDTWASRTRKRSEAGCGWPEDGGLWTAKTVKRPPQQPAHPQYTNYWAPLTRNRHILPHPAQPQHTNHWAPRTWKRHQQDHRPQQPTESSDPTQHAKGRRGSGALGWGGGGEGGLPAVLDSVGEFAPVLGMRCRVSASFGKFYSQQLSSGAGTRARQHFQ